MNLKEVKLGRVLLAETIFRHNYSDQWPWPMKAFEVTCWFVSKGGSLRVLLGRILMNDSLKTISSWWQPSSTLLYHVSLWYLGASQKSKYQVGDKLTTISPWWNRLSLAQKSVSIVTARTKHSFQDQIQTTVDSAPGTFGEEVTTIPGSVQSGPSTTCATLWSVITWSCRHPSFHI